MGEKSIILFPPSLLKMSVSINFVDVRHPYNDINNSIHLHFRCFVLGCISELAQEDNGFRTRLGNGRAVFPLRDFQPLSYSAEG